MKINKYISLQNIGGNIYIFNEKNGKVLKFNNSASEIWSGIVNKDGSVAE